MGGIRRNMKVYYYNWLHNSDHPYDGFYVDINGKPKCLFASDYPDNPKHWKRAKEMANNL